ncbi:MAG TPA: zinc ribbon domain-containing protein [Spirochaetia bacterium]|nr:zinc ribbon domain-containing protein [Spirochaetia bacterium]
MKNCIACGMPMETREDHAMGDETKDYCRYCARPDGSMQNYREKLEGMAAFVVRTQGIDAEAARKIAAESLSTLPAWRDQIN